MVEEYKLISERSELRVKRGQLYSMMNDTKSSAQFRDACQKRINDIDKKMEKIKNQIIEERQRRWKNY